MSKSWRHHSKFQGPRKVWDKLSRLKGTLRLLKKTEFSNVESRFVAAHELLQKVQMESCVNAINIELITKERLAIRELQKWLHVEEMDAQQKVRISWLKLGDNNTAFFHNAMCERMGSNRIDKLLNDNGITLKKPEEIEFEILMFYKNLLSSPNTQKALDPSMLTRGPVVDREEVTYLCKGVSF